MRKSLHKSMCILGEIVLIRTILIQIAGSIIDNYLVVMTTPLEFAKKKNPPKTSYKYICL